MQQTLPKVTFGNTEEQVSRIGYGCMGLSAFYTTNPISEEEALNVIGEALNQGQNFFDTAALYGDNELLMAKAIKKFGREKFFLATKVLPFKFENGKRKKVSATKENIKFYCEYSLKRLEIQQIDLFYMHRVDPEIPIEKQAEAMKELIKEGKIKYYGLSEVSEETIRRAHKVHPITAIQEEFSLMSRDIEQNGVLKACQELKIALVAYSPICRGLLSGNISNSDQIDSKDSRKQRFPRFEGQNLVENHQKVEKLKEISEEVKGTLAQVSLAWLLTRGDNIFPIPGTKSIKYLTENNQSVNIKLSEQQLQRIDELFPPGIASGTRYAAQLQKQLTVNTRKLNK